MYQIYLGNQKIAEIAGVEAAWAVYCKTAELAHLLNERARLIGPERGEVLESPAC